MNIVGFFVILFLIVWCISPFILLPLYLWQRSESRKKIQYIKALESQIAQFNLFAQFNPQDDKSKPKPISTPAVIFGGQTLAPSQVEHHASKEHPFCAFCGCNVLAILGPEKVFEFCPTCGANVVTGASKQLSSLQGTFLSENVTATAPVNPEPSVQRTKERGGNPFTMASILLYLGVLFILIAGAIFVTSSWNTLPDSVRALIVFILPVFFFAICGITEKWLKLSITGKAFYYLGCLFIPIAFVAVDQFSIMGSWFTFTGGGKYALLTTCLSLFSLSSAIGFWRYKSTVFIYLTGFTASAALWFLTLFLGGGYYLSLTCVSVLSFLCIVLTRKNTERKTLLHIRIYAYLSMLLNMLLGLYEGGNDLLLHIIAVLTILASYTFMVFYNTTHKKHFVRFFPLVASWALLTLTITVIENTSISSVFAAITDFYGVSVQKYITGSHLLAAGFVSLFFLFHFSKKLFKQDIRNTLSDVLFTVAPLIPLFWLMFTLHDDISLDISLWFATGTTVALGIAFFVTAIGNKEDYTEAYTYTFPFIVLGSFAPVSALINRYANMDPSFIYGSYIPVACAVFLMVLVTGIILHVKKKDDFTKKFSFSFNCAIFLWGVLWILLTLALKPVFISWYVLSLGLYFAVLFAIQLKNGIKESLYLYISSFALLLFPAIVVHYNAGVDWFFAVAVLSLVATLALLPTVIRPLKLLNHIELRYASTITLISAAVFALITFKPDHSLLGIAIVVAIALLSILSLRLSRISILNLIGILIIWIIVISGTNASTEFLGVKLNNYSPLIASILLFVITLILGRLIYGKSLIRRGQKDISIDYLSFSALITPFLFLFSEPFFGIRNGAIVHGSLYLLLTVVLSFIGRGPFVKGQYLLRPLLTFAIVIVALAFLTQPYFRLSALITTEYSLVIMLASAFVISRIWAKSIFDKWALYLATVVAILVQFGDIVNGKNPLFDATVLGSSMAIVLFLGFFLKKLRWFVLSAVTLAIFAIYLSREFWLSINWWVYLLICGTLMISFAAVFEYKRRKDKKHKTDNN